jgi:DNA-binding transcriptional LysR family regulator
MKTKTTLDQWLVLKTVIEQGGFAQAAEFLHRSQSTISYAVAQLQNKLGVKILQTEGRKSALTPVGKILLHRASLLLDGVYAIEKIAYATKEGWPAEITIAVDDPFPRDVIAAALKSFAALAQTRVQIFEASLSGALEILDQGFADIVVAYNTPKGYMEFSQAEITQIAVAHHEHPLHHLPFQLTIEDLKNHIQLVVRDSGKTSATDKGFLDIPQRWTVASSQMALHLLQSGIGFAWLPSHYVKYAKDLKPLPLLTGQKRKFFLSLLYGKKSSPNQAALAFADCIKQALADYHQQD